MNTDELSAYLTSASGVVLVDFWAPWCGPCKQLDKWLEKLEARGQHEIVRINIDEDWLTAQRFGVESLPTVQVWRGNVQRECWTGDRAAKEIARWCK